MIIKIKQGQLIKIKNAQNMMFYIYKIINNKLNLLRTFSFSHLFLVKWILKSIAWFQKSMF